MGGRLGGRLHSCRNICLLLSPCFFVSNCPKIWGDVCPFFFLFLYFFPQAGPSIFPYPNSFISGTVKFNNAWRQTKTKMFLKNSFWRIPCYFLGGKSGNVTIIKSTRRERAEVTKKKKRRRSGCHSSQKKVFSQNLT